MRIDDLNIDGLVVAQEEDSYCFNSDSVLLANSVMEKPSSSVVELGAGCGVISILLAGKLGYRAVTSVEVQGGMFSLLEKSIELCFLGGAVTAINCDIKNIKSHLKSGAYDICVFNPPYEKADGKDTVLSNCRTENLATLQDFIFSATSLVRHGGHIYFIVKIQRLGEALTLLHLAGAEAKLIKFIYPKLSKGVDTVIIKAQKGAKAYLKSQTLILYNEDGSETAALKEIYSRSKNACLEGNLCDDGKSV